MVVRNILPKVWRL